MRRKGGKGRDRKEKTWREKEKRDKREKEKKAQKKGWGGGERALTNFALPGYRASSNELHNRRLLCDSAPIPSYTYKVLTSCVSECDPLEMSPQGNNLNEVTRMGCNPMF